MNSNKTVFFFALLFFFLVPTTLAISAENVSCTTYFTGIGCPYCAQADPFLLETALQENPELVIIEYEVYQQSENAQLMLEYNTQYASGTGIPVLIVGINDFFVGPPDITQNIQSIVEKENNPCPLQNGTENFEIIDLTSLPKSPKIWRNDRILFPTTKNGNNETLKELVLSDNILETLAQTVHTKTTAQPVLYSGGSVQFENAVIVDGWIFQWNGDPLPPNGETPPNGNNGSDTNNGTIPPIDPNENNTPTEGLTLAKLVSLAAVDAVNPCALAVLTLILIAILTHNPKNKHKVLFAGLSFTIAVFVMYLFYGLVIIKFFQIIQALTSIRLLLYTLLGFVAIILGLLNIKDFFRYKPGSIGTEMPMFLRPHVQKIISGVTSPRGAFIVGLFVTVFLLPCTIGPYVIAGGILSTMELIQTIPPLLLYNFIFVLPMLAITIIIYQGIAHVEDVSTWKDQNIRHLHLIAGIIMVLLGIAMILGWL
ncbi:hypothetical protein KKE06_05590 [Candidatus Micrarchaeota archaeon]|nr:hypothetical protein [Candidatus Micrarchaeota archaeon]MBU1930600.1 hypothetical protein [Candidatus Micrarchaeota archaeon]